MKLKRRRTFFFSRIKKHYKYFLSLLAFFLVFYLFYKFFSSDIFNVRYLDCKIKNTKCTSSQEADLLSYLGKNIFLINTIKIQKNYLSNNYRYINLSVNRILPNKLSVKIEDRTAVGLIKIKDEYYFFDHMGVIFSKEKDKKNLTQVELYPGFPLNLGVKSDELGRVSDLFTLLSNYQLGIDRFILAGNNSLIAKFGGDSQAVFALDKNLNKQVASLQLILSRSKIEGKMIKKIDLRFSKPVAVFHHE